MQFDYKHYVPCLRWKQGEYQSVFRLSNETKASFTPLIEVPEIVWDFEKEKDCKTIDKHLEPFAKRIINKWGKAPCFIDLRCIESSERMQDGTHPVRFIFNELRQENCFAIPSVSLNSDSRYKKEIKEIINEDKNGACLRISLEQVSDEMLKDNIDSINKILKIQLGEIHLVLDINAPNFVPLDGFMKLLETLIKRIPYLKEWRTFSIIGTSFPETMGGIKEGIEFLPRYEWQLYQKLIRKLRKEKIRIPTFGDYGIQHPNILQLDMRLVNPSANIRYTTEDRWMIVKGKGTRVKDGFKQFRDLSKKIISTSYYCGPDFSYGDSYIKKCAYGEISPGNLTTWRQVGTNHHVSKVIMDISNFYAF